MEILFRGKPDISPEWLDEMEFTLDEYMENLVSVNYKDGFVFGQLVYSGKQPYIVGEVVESTDEWITLEYWIPVKPETVGQYTGLEDKNGVEIYEGDFIGSSTTLNLLVSIREGHATITFKDGKTTHSQPIFREEITEEEHLVVIGNRWDNPELLEVLGDEN